MTPRPRPDPRGGEPAGRNWAATLRSTAQQARAHLRHNRADLVALPKLAGALQVTQEMLRAAVARDADLGICGQDSTQYVCWVPPDALSAGFRPVVLDGQLALRLAAADPRGAPLHISGRHLGPAPQAELDLPELRGARVGPLGYTVTRLLLMTNRWLTESTGSTQHTLFELIAHTWRTNPDPVWTSGRLHVHQTQHTDPSTLRLELVIWADEQGALHLVNVYPAGTHRTVFDPEVPDE